MKCIRDEINLSNRRLLYNRFQRVAKYIDRVRRLRVELKFHFGNNDRAMAQEEEASAEI